MSQEHTVRVDNGKYTFIKRGLTIVIDRYDEPWHEQQQAFNALASLMAELDAARVVLEAVRVSFDRGELPAGVVDALSKHEALVNDSEKPSEWTK